MSIYEKTKCARALLYWAANNNGNEAYYLEDRMYAVADNGMVIILTADSYDEAIRKAKARPQDKWVPITYRPMTEEEVKRVETYFGLPLDEKEKKCFSCPMPEHGQEILISTEWGVYKDSCLYDCDEGFSLDERGDWEDVDAWMPLPEPYKEADNDRA